MLIYKRTQKPLPFGGIFGNDIADETLRGIDNVLDDDELIDILRRSYERGVGSSKRKGAPMVALNRLVRTITLKHLKNWSFRDLHRELQPNLDYRAFTKFFDDRIGSFKSFSRNAAWIDSQAVREMNEWLVKRAVELGVVRGKSFRQDTTVTEANIHYPADSTLLQDGMRVLQRLARRAEEIVPALGRTRDRSRSALHRVLEIHRAAKSRQPDAKDRRVKAYRKMMVTSRSVVTRAKRVADKLRDGRVTRHLGLQDQIVVESIAQEIDKMQPRVEQVLRQTRARIVRGVNNYPGKIVSIFVPEAVVIQKGKAHKQAEFGQLVDLVEVENGVVSDYRVHQGNPADVTLLIPAIWRHKQRFGHVPRRVATDRGFFSAANEQAAHEMGVKQVSIPGRGKLGDARRLLQRSRWFRKLQRWRANGEGRIGTLKNRYGMDRCMYKGPDAMERWVGWCVFANNLTSVARYLARTGASSEETTGKNVVSEAA